MKSASLSLYKVFQRETAIYRGNVSEDKLHRHNQKYLVYPTMNGYGDIDASKTWPSCGSMYCTVRTTYKTREHNKEFNVLLTVHHAMILGNCAT